MFATIKTLYALTMIQAHAFANDTRASINKYMSVFVLAILALATLGVVASFASTAAADANFTAAQVVLIALVPLALIIGVVIVIFRTVTE